MASYKNGRFPLSMFEHLGGNIYLPPATAARVRGFGADVKDETGVTLRITGDIDGLGGWNGYRPFDAQVRYKAHYGPGAAEPGKSSHGGIYRGSDFFAVDFANSGDVPWSTFVRLAKKWGLMTDFVTPTERWHVGDPNPWTMPAGTPSGPAVPESNTVTGAEMYIIRAAGRTPTIIGAGYVRTLNEEEAANLGAIVSKDTTVNARQFDLAVSAASTGSVSGPSEGSFTVSSPNRKKTLIGAGFVRTLNDEEANNAAIYFTNRNYVVNDRQFDLAVSVALTGQVPKIA